MKQLTFILLIITSHFILAQGGKPAYDKALAERLGGNENGMKSYVFVILKTGPRDSLVKDQKLRDSLFKGHMDNIQRLSKEGKLVLAGPFGKNDKKYRGLFIFNVKTVEEATALVNTDPTVKEKIFDVDITPWYGSAAVCAIPEIHEKISK
jgi:uncharacterized protein YciI